MFIFLGALFLILLFLVLIIFIRSERSNSRIDLPHALLEEYWNGRERRQHIRFQKKLEVIYTLGKKAHAKKNGNTLDISEGGAKLMLNEKLAPGTIMDLKVAVPNSAITAEMESEVVWSEDASSPDNSGRRVFYSGVEFLAMKEPGRTYFINYVRSL